MKYLKTFNESFERLTYSDIEDIKELWYEGMSVEDILNEMDHKDYITIEDIEQLIKDFEK